MTPLTVIINQTDMIIEILLYCNGYFEEKNKSYYMRKIILYAKTWTLLD